MAKTMLSPKNIQYAALPWRMRNGVREMLLITSRNTRRWIVPKGWPLKGCSPPECAALQALEEAGVSGRVQSKPLGVYRYKKIKRSGAAVFCTVQVFGMKVTRQRRKWREKKARDWLWCAPAEAIKHIKEAGLRKIVAKFAGRRLRAASKKKPATRAKTRTRPRK
jgi:8-oxo-dGTP pyrophosphatase MutT (NUDIX family)